MRARLLTAVLLSTLLLAGCIPASPDVDTYDSKAALTLGAGVSDARTVQRVLQALHDGRILRPTAIAQLRYSEKSLDTANGAFNEINPPPTRDTLAGRTSSLLTRAGDLVVQARTALERDRASRYPSLAAQLATVATKMENLQGQVQ